MRLRIEMRPPSLIQKVRTGHQQVFYICRLILVGFYRWRFLLISLCNGDQFELLRVVRRGEPLVLSWRRGGDESYLVITELDPVITRCLILVSVASNANRIHKHTLFEQGLVIGD